MDGRAIKATIKLMKPNYHLDFIDVISEPGMDSYLGKMSTMDRLWIKQKIKISIINHGSRIISIVGHDDCAGNPVNTEEHRMCIKADILVMEQIVKEVDPSLAVEIIGLWVHITEDPRVWIAEKI